MNRSMVAEKKNKNHLGKGEAAKIVLQTIAVAGFLTMAVVAPNALQALPKLGLLPTKYNRRRYIDSVVGRLRVRGLLELTTNTQGVKCLRLTKKGENELRRYELGELRIKKPKRWDGQYRVIIFDIKEWKRGKRDELRAWLQELGFRRLQNSVWVYPYECEEVIKLLKAHFELGREVLYLTVVSIENDRWLRQEFGLSPTG